MIQIYSPSNTNFDMNGDMVLFPEICDAYSKLNGEWYLDIEHPLDEEGRWKYIVEEAVISVPTFMGKNQLFKIEKVTKTDTEIIAKAYPIFFDSADELFLYSCHPTSKNGQEALDIMTAGSKYSGESNITPVSTAYFENRNFMDCVNGDDSPTFLQRWGGEVLYDNYKIIINERVGGDYGAEIRYRKNQESISCDIDMSEMVTRIVPIAYNGRGATNKYVDSPNVNKYSKLYTRKMLFENVKLAEDASEEEDESIVICADQAELDEVLAELCNAQFEAGADKPKVTIDVNMVDLTQTEEYKDFAELEKIGLGDTVRCYNKVLEITTEARCIILTWDCIKNCAKNIVLGDYQYDYFAELQSSLEVLDKIIGPGNTIMAERIQGVLNAMNTQLRYQKTAAKKQDVRAILFEDLDPESELFGALCLGTQGMQISNKRTADNRDWEWTTAWTAHGGYANTLVLGILADKTGKNSWNLETGELVLEGFATFKALEEDGETVINGSNITTGTIKADRIDLEELFAKAITATDMKITGKSTFLSEDSVFENKIEIKDGKLTITGTVEESVNYGLGTKHYLTSSGPDGRSTGISARGITIIGDSIDDPDHIEDAQSIDFYKEKGADVEGSINIFGIYGGDRGVLGKILGWDGNAYLNNIYATGFVEVSEITVDGIKLNPAILIHSDNIGYVGLYKDGSYYYMRPYQASKILSGSSSYPWYDIYSERLHVTKERLVCKPSYDNTNTYLPNTYIGNTGIFTRTTETSSRTLKYDIYKLGETEELDARKLYDVDVVQFKYNDGVITDKEDCRYGKDLPGFIIEDLAEKYPIAVDMPSKNVQEWSWNQRYMIPAMLKLIQELNERVARLEGSE